MRVLTVHQPWAWAIAHGGKDVENRSWTTRYRGLMCIHAGLQFAEYGSWPGHPGRPPEPWELLRGKIIAVVRLVDVSENAESRWAEPGKFHWVLADRFPLPVPVACRGNRGLIPLPADVAGRVLAQLPTDYTGA